jgi:glutamate transport system permease protein
VSSVLYDHAGPRTRARNWALTGIFAVLLLLLAWYVIGRFGAHDQWAAAKWKPFTRSSVWVDFLLPGLVQTLKAAAMGMVLALAFAVVFATGRLSERWWLRGPAGAVVEFFRAVPLLLMIFFIFYGVPFLLHRPSSAYWSVVLGLTLYNGSVLAEAIRAGILSLPSGQSEAAYALGMRKSQVMVHILVPQAARVMLPVIVSQLVVLLKDTALGYIIAYPEILQKASELTANYSNTVPVALVVAGIFITVNSSLTALAGWLERRTRRRVAGRPTATDAPVGEQVLEPQG